MNNMKRKKLVLLTLILVLSPFLITVSSRAFETFGSDKQISDPANDVWKPTWSGTTISGVTKSSQFPAFDIIRLSIDDSGTNYTVTLELGENYNSTAMTENLGSIIILWFDANGTNIVNYSESFFWLSISSFYPTGYVYCYTYKGVLLLDTATTINNQYIIWTFPKTNIIYLIDNIKSIGEWRVTGWSTWVHGFESEWDYCIDYLADPESDAAMAACEEGNGNENGENGDNGENNGQNGNDVTSMIPGFPTLILIGITGLSILILLKKVLKHKVFQR